MSTTTNDQGIKKESLKSEIVFDKFQSGEFQKEGTVTAQIRQIITTKSTYPSKKTSSTLQDNIFSNEEFGFDGQEYESKEERVAWLLVPESTTEETVKAKLAMANSKGACIYRVLSNKPIVDEHQAYAINEGLVTLDHFANKQAVRYPAGDPKEGLLVLDKQNNVQYKRTFFWSTPKEDIDIRKVGEVYLSAELKAEMSGASIMSGQTI